MNPTLIYTYILILFLKAKQLNKTEITTIRYGVQRSNITYNYVLGTPVIQNSPHGAMQRSLVHRQGVSVQHETADRPFSPCITQCGGLISGRGNTIFGCSAEKRRQGFGCINDHWVSKWQSLYRISNYIRVLKSVLHLHSQGSILILSSFFMSHPKMFDIFRRIHKRHSCLLHVPPSLLFFIHSQGNHREAHLHPFSWSKYSPSYFTLTFTPSVWVVSKLQACHQYISAYFCSRNICLKYVRTHAHARAHTHTHTHTKRWRETISLQFNCATSLSEKQRTQRTSLYPVLCQFNPSQIPTTLSSPPS